MKDEELFSGIAVVVDDEVNVEATQIGQICAAIKESGSHVIGLTTPPSDQQIQNLSAISFFIVDWNLDGVVPADSLLGVTRPSGLSRQSEEKTLALLKKLKERRVAPVFVFTGEDPEEVQRKITEYLPEGSHVLVKSKSEVIAEGVPKILADWVKTSAPAYVLKHWEHEYERAKQSFFQDFYSKSVDWPVVLWNTFGEDGVPASNELGRIISRNIQSRMTPFDFDLTPFKRDAANQGDERALLIRVLEGERYVLDASLHQDSIAPGDLFREGKHYYLNIRPECDCVARGGDSSDQIELYLLRGGRLTENQQKKIEDRDYGVLREKDNESVVFPLDAGKGISFSFKQIERKLWREFKGKRLGRLLPPHLTRLQERFAAYLQRPGLPRYPPAAFYPKEADITVETAAEETPAAVAPPVLPGAPNPQVD